MKILNIFLIPIFIIILGNFKIFLISNYLFINIEIIYQIISIVIFTLIFTNFIIINILAKILNNLIILIFYLILRNFKKIILFNNKIIFEN